MTIDAGTARTIVNAFRCPPGVGVNPATLKCVLMTLYCVAPPGRRLYASMEYLADRSGPISVRTCQRVMSVLCGASVIKAIPTYNEKGERRSNEFEIDYERLAEWSGLELSTRVEQCAPPRQTVTPTPTVCHPHPDKLSPPLKVEPLPRP